ncbi:hypothetical protein M426DRAFT_139756 [Hypoxylon sp. CI-4A]|nr:hypothetical protein M426DRAFT_139756 [Hypoxylon sp. CI-4A]
MADRKAFIVGISGASSSGKTTLARLLRDVFPSTFVLHEDDFYKPDAEIPTKDGLADWDCAEAISIPDMTRALAYIRENGTFPPFVDSKEDQNSVGACPVPDAAIQAAKSKVASWTAPGQPGHAILVSSSSSSSSSSSKPLRICILDGFLLYSPEMEAGGVTNLLDTKMFLLVSHESVVQRRERRDGYVTLDGFWKDPPGYVDKIVWPNYVEAHAGLFEGGDVEGKLDEGILKEKSILAQTGEGLDVDMTTTFNWAVDTLIRQLEEFAGKEGER